MQLNERLELSRLFFFFSAKIITGEYSFDPVLIQVPMPSSKGGRGRCFDASGQ